jgi:hypothetical protein
MFYIIWGRMTMRREERILRDLCIEIAKGEIGGDRFNQLLLETGIYLDEYEWEAANRLLGKSDQILQFASMVESVQ